MIALLNRITIRRWAWIGLFNLFCVASLGLLMRLKFLMPLPWMDQKNFMHAHSHFAFSGWVSHILMVLILMRMYGKVGQDTLPPKYQRIILANVLLAFAMLISFSSQGYGVYSIVFSTLSLLISYVFAFYCWRDLDEVKLDYIVVYWFRAALFFLVLSSLGTFFLAYLRATHIIDTRKQLASVYFYLHFQYNGWFFFACMGLFSYWLHVKGIILYHAKTFFVLFFFCVLPTYLLSVLWLNIPAWLYLLLGVVVIVQLLAWTVYVYAVVKAVRKVDDRTAVVKWMQGGVLLAVFVKLLLQALSAIPSLSQLVYGFRPVVIAYLHLVLLVIITLFIISYIYQMNVLHIRQGTVYWTVIMIVGIVSNELLLALQGVSSLIGFFIQHIPLGLAVVSAMMVCGIAGVFWSVRE
jgi:hypothetical protein